MHVICTAIHTSLLMVVYVEFERDIFIWNVRSHFCTDTHEKGFDIYSTYIYLLLFFRKVLFILEDVFSLFLSNFIDLFTIIYGSNNAVLFYFTTVGDTKGHWDWESECGHRSCP